MPDDRDPDRPHDTDPAVADTMSSGARAAVSAPVNRGRRAVRTGDQLDRYELLEEVGEGGMATVYRARDRELRREVAVKVLFPHLARRDELVRRFHREARAAAGLEHPHILRIYDVGGGGADNDDPPYIVMELIRGRTLLAEVEARGPLLAEIVACIGALLADALAVAHAAGIVHRDLKPANVLITGDGRLLLADFGVARIENDDSLVTRTGALLGTPAYMSPEQARGETATAQSDLYSLGATLYQLATGGLPYAGSPAKVISAITAGPPMPALRRRPAVGPDLSRAIERVMATEPAARPADARVLAAELAAIAKAGGLGDPGDEAAAYFADAATYLRERTPSVVSAMVTAAEAAIADEKLPRAMALADRASAIAPEDPQVAALIASVTEGGKSRARRRRAVSVALAAVGIAVVGGGVAMIVAMHGSGGGNGSGSGGSGSGSGSGNGNGNGSGNGLVAIDAAVVIATTPIDAAIAMSTTPIDARVIELGRPRSGARIPSSDARLPSSDARIPSSGSDPDAAAVSPPPIDAALAVVVSPPPALAPGAILVVNDTWCDVAIDNASRGRNLPNVPFAVAAGHHVVACAQPSTSHQWSRDADVAPGQTVTVAGSMIPEVDITIAIGSQVTIDGAAFAPGAVAHIKAGRIAFAVGGRTTYLDIRASCTLREASDTLSCGP